MKKQGTISQNQYAKMCGCSHTAIAKAIEQGKISEGVDQATGRIHPDRADLEWGIEFREKRALQLAMKSSKMDPEDGADWSALDRPDPEIPKNAKANELIRLKLYYETRLAKIKVEETEGKLVDRQAMERESREFGGTIRKAMQAVPDRIIDQLLSLERNEAHQLLAEQINEALEFLSDDSISDQEGA